MPTETISPVAPTAEPFELSGEACDANSTGSERASVRVWIGETPLHFCAHHARKHLDAWVAAGYRIEAPEGVLDW